MLNKLREFPGEHINCDFVGYSEEELDRHRRRDHRSHFRYWCNKCHFVSVTSDQLCQHSAIQHSTAYLPPAADAGQMCLVCHQNFPTWTLYFAHIRSHPQNKYACDECPFVFSSPQHLNGHCQSAHDTRHFACPHCTEDFASNDFLFAHMRAQSIQCYFCFESVLTEEDLEKHMRQYHKEDIISNDA